MDWRILIGLTVMSWTLYSVILRSVSEKMSWQISMFAFVIGYAVVSTLVGGIHMKATGWQQVVSTPVFVACVCGAICGLGAMAFFKALPLAPGSIVNSLVGMYIPLTAIACLIFLREPVSARTVIGILCAGLAVVLLSR